jgi:DNA-binding CsgD family transcriptional regulator
VRFGVSEVTGSATAGNDAALVGREEELARLRELVAPPHAESRTLLLLGESGTGKTMLVAQAVHAARAAGMRVLAAAGRESEQDLAFAGLHQLLRPVLSRLSCLPARQADALRAVFALSGVTAPPDALLAGIAVLTLLSVVSDEEPLLVAVDDAQWLDQASLDALSFASHRMAEERIVLLVSARGAVPPAGFEREFPQLLLRPLQLPDAGRLLDTQPSPPRGRAREQVLAQAAGNPMALVELSGLIASDPDAGHRWAAEPLPLAGQLTAIMAARYAALPGAARTALLLAAAADSPDLSGYVADLTIEALAPAEAAGLIRLDNSGLQFTHPLARSGVYYGASFEERAAAHMKIAASLRGSPDRYAWHLASAALGPDEQVASLLEDSAAEAQRRGGAAAAARTMERAARLSPDDRDKARRLLAAADLAHAAGQSDWVREMASRIAPLTSDPDLRIAARQKIGWSLVWSNQHAEALETLLSVAADARVRQPAFAWDAAGIAATIAHQTGLPEARARVRAVFDDLEAARAAAPGTPDPQASRADEARLWIRACTDPFGGRADILPDLHRIVAGPLSDPAKVGGAAWTLDETELAVQVLREAITELRAPGVRGSSGAVLSVLEWACLDSGRWDEALSVAREASDIAAAYKMETVAASADLVTATTLALRGEHTQVPSLLARVPAAVDETVYRGFAARVRHAAGLAALGQGRHVTAYAQLSQEFEADGTSLHYQFSYYAMADLAAAAVRAERRLEAKTRLEHALEDVGPPLAPRLEQLAARARGLLADSAEAEGHFAAGLADPAGKAWPFERAQLELDYGEWLRRQRRINDAKPLLGSALEAFSRLGAEPWTRRAESELRACGVAATARAAPWGPLNGLTPQQREVATLASRGLTNGEIADRLFLSPRTVASHLHRSYPKLGIAGRHQLRDLIEQAGTSQGNG